MGADFIDCVLADGVVLPEAERNAWSEEVVYLPGCYQPNDDGRVIGPEPGPRPAAGFVFCCFNNSYKITPAVFDVWVRLLGAVPDSVLWLLEDNAEARRNLDREAAARGVDPARLVFAPRLSQAAHLARHALADLCLDTVPVNAHTGASDALWAGLPLVTCAGNAFAGRVGASLLHAVGLPELVTRSLAEYEALALALARDPVRLRGLRRRLEENRRRTPLFDTARFCRQLEATLLDLRARR
jgi:predicted O-linked N-acetylglucosamine transferase (SPINDLY family)